MNANAPTINVLHIAYSSSMGGIESFILNVVKTIDRSRFQVDIITESKIIPSEDILKSYGCNIIRCTTQRNIIGYFVDIYRLLKYGKYDCVHFHKNSAANIAGIVAAKITGVKNIVIHSHNTNPNGGFFLKYCIT